MSSEPVWVKSSYSSYNGNCVEVAGSWVRDSKDPNGPVLEFGAQAWQLFIDEVKGGGFLFGGAR
jgi:hypothetical protein